ncbi:HEPN/Toprim-associated domain-containing protein [Pseudomonas sp. Z6-14]|uniref:HEPN/Toprim-associated domain-containing protein n=1 Tax=unclassified Pseudomonas TaxID=196821 RepID=UPI003DAA333B
MSTPITLSVGDIDLTYNTGFMGVDHGMLYQDCDRRYRRHPGINYKLRWRMEILAIRMIVSAKK